MIISAREVSRTIPKKVLKSCFGQALYIILVTTLVLAVLTWLMHSGLTNITFTENPQDTPLRINLDGRDGKDEISVLWSARILDDGFARESVDFMAPLSELLDFGWYDSGATVSDLLISQLYSDLSSSDKKTMMDLWVKGSNINNNFMSKDVISVVCDRPTRYEELFVRTRLKHSTYNIGRAMFESDWIPNNWEYLINEYLDELWVPSQFSHDVFKSAGVYIPIKIIQEGFDGKIFTGNLKYALNSPENINPQKREGAKRIVVNLRQKYFSECQPNDVIFLSVGKAEPRKGIEELIEVFSKMFTKSDNVCLYIRSKLGNRIRKRVSEIQLAGVRLFEIKHLSIDELGLVYSAADVFILPTHGEGWGRPIMEAMASGLPVIVTYWSGLTDFVDPSWAMTIPVTRFEPAFEKDSSLIGGKQYQSIHKWAEINLGILRARIMWAIANPDKRNALGLKARKVMFERFERNIIAKTVEKRILEVKSEIKSVGISSLKEEKALKNKVRMEESTYQYHEVPARLNDIKRKIGNLHDVMSSSDTNLDRILQLFKSQSMSLEERENREQARGAWNKVNDVIRKEALEENFVKSDEERERGENILQMALEEAEEAEEKLMKEPGTTQDGEEDKDDDKEETTESFGLQEERERVADPSSELKSPANNIMDPESM